MEKELSPQLVVFAVLNKIFFHKGSKMKEVENKSIENKRIFTTMNFYIQLYGKLEKQIKVLLNAGD